MSQVTWIRKTVLANGLEVAISDNSGIVKVTLPGMNQRSIMAYADEFLQFMANFTEFQRYLEANDDVALSRDQSKDIRKVKRTQERIERNAVQALQALTPEQLQKLLGRNVG